MLNRSSYDDFVWCSNIVSMAYLGFRKGGAKFSLATRAHTKEGANQFFQFFFNVKKNFFFPKGHGPMAPPKYASVLFDGKSYLLWQKLSVMIPFVVTNFNISDLQ